MCAALAVYFYAVLREVTELPDSDVPVAFRLVVQPPGAGGSGPGRNNLVVYRQGRTNWRRNQIISAGELERVELGSFRVSASAQWSKMLKS